MYKYLIVLLGFSLAGCSNTQFPGIYRLPIEQGNIITQEMVDQLKPGMSRSQVEYIMGSSVIKDSFNPDRWDYVYTLRRGDLSREQKNLTVFFEDDKMAYFESDVEPSPKKPAKTETEDEEEPSSED
jgi:outer membrane protein assembly factor BamE